MSTLSQTHREREKDINRFFRMPGKTICQNGSGYKKARWRRTLRYQQKAHAICCQSACVCLFQLFKIDIVMWIWSVLCYILTCTHYSLVFFHVETIFQYNPLLGTHTLWHTWTQTHIHTHTRTHTHTYKQMYTTHRNTYKDTN